WIHPFIYSLSDYMAPTLEAAAGWIEEELIGKKCPIKGPEVMQTAMHHYLETQLSADHGMKELVGAYPHLANKAESICCAKN
ncbi:MAG: hypothetical protein JWO53_438, partial [Chlamydiia bacterium]|nr:hypothetical protein [Chlamydiia bacterium]